MALPLPAGLTPPEIAFLCEMELVTVMPRQRMDSLPLLSGPTPPLQAGRSAPLPLYLALLLHRQKRANIAPPPWLSLSSLESILKTELENPAVFSPSAPWPTSSSNSRRDGAIISPPFIPHSTATSTSNNSTNNNNNLPYHYIELSTLLLTHCPDSFASHSEVDALRALVRDLREVRQSKLRAGMKGLEGGGVVSLRGVGAMEVAAERGFVVGVVGGLRVLGGSREGARREREEEDGEGDGGVGDGGFGREGEGEEEEDGDGMDF